MQIRPAIGLAIGWLLASVTLRSVLFPVTGILLLAGLAACAQPGRAPAWVYWNDWQADRLYDAPKGRVIQGLSGASIVRRQPTSPGPQVSWMTFEVDGQEELPEGWHKGVLTVDYVPDEAEPRADLCGTWILNPSKIGRPVVLELRSNGSVTLQDVTMTEGRWGSLGPLVWFDCARPCPELSVPGAGQVSCFILYPSGALAGLHYRGDCLLSAEDIPSETVTFRKSE